MNCANPKLAARRGFSFIELMAVVALVGIIVAITITRIAQSSDAAREKTCYHNRAQINAAIERYAVTLGIPATSISDVNTNDYFPDGVPVCPVDGAAYTLNTTTQRVDGHTTSANH
ncbi:MAG: type II secretion system protein [Planctomycetota bacterium]